MVFIPVVFLADLCYVVASSMRFARTGRRPADLRGSNRNQLDDKDQI